MMLEFSLSFFRYQRPLLTNDELEEINKKLKSIYQGEDSILYSNDAPESFEKSKAQLCALLDYYTLIAPNLTLFESYKTNIKKLLESSPQIDLSITFAVAKEKLELFILFFEKKYKAKEFDAEKFNKYTVTICYQGAYSNLLQALGISTLSDLTDIKLAYLISLATEYLKKTNFEYPPENNEIHYANALVNKLTTSYGFLEVKDGYAPILKRIDHEAFKCFVATHFRVASFIEFARNYSPILHLPNEVIDAADSTYAEKDRQITAFFAWLGEPKVPANELDKLYEIDFDANTYFHMRPKEDFDSRVNLLLIRYFEKAKQVEGVSIQIGNQSFVGDGKTLVRFTEKEDYQFLSQEDILNLLKDVEDKNEEPQLTRLLEHLDAKMLCERYSKLAPSSPNEAAYVNVLLKQPHWFETETMVDKISDWISKADTLQRKQLLMACLRAEFSDHLFKLLFKNLSLTEGELLYCFQFALENNLGILVSFLLDNYVSVLSRNSYSLLFLAFTYSSSEIIDIVLDKFPAYLHVVNLKGQTLIHLAAEKGYVNIIDKLLQKGVDPFQKDSLGKTPRDIAKERGHRKVVTLLNSFKTMVLPSLKLVVTAERLMYYLKFALENNLVYLSSYLLDNYVFDSSFSSPLLLFAFTHSSPAVIDIVLDKFPAHLDVVNLTGQTLIHLAAEKGYVDIINKLIKKGVDPCKKDTLGRTPLDIANERGHMKVVKLLLEFTADIGEEQNIGEGQNIGEKEEIIYKIGAGLVIGIIIIMIQEVFQEQEQVEVAPLTPLQIVAPSPLQMETSSFLSSLSLEVLEIIKSYLSSSKVLMVCNGVFTLAAIYRVYQCITNKKKHAIEAMELKKNEGAKIDLVDVAAKLLTMDFDIEQLSINDELALLSLEELQELRPLILAKEGVTGVLSEEELKAIKESDFIKKQDASAQPRADALLMIEATLLKISNEKRGIKEKLNLLYAQEQIWPDTLKSPQSEAHIKKGEAVKPKENIKEEVNTAFAEAEIKNIMETTKNEAYAGYSHNLDLLLDMNPEQVTTILNKDQEMKIFDNGIDTAAKKIEKAAQDLINGKKINGQALGNSIVQIGKQMINKIKNFVCKEKAINWFIQGCKNALVRLGKWFEDHWLAFKHSGLGKTIFRNHLTLFEEKHERGHSNLDAFLKATEVINEKLEKEKEVSINEKGFLNGLR